MTNYLVTVSLLRRPRGGGHLVDSTANCDHYSSLKVCNYAYNEDCGVRTALESVLAACGVVTFGVNLSAAVVLVSLWSGNVMS